MREAIDWTANPINALFRLIEFSDAGEPLPPEMIKWLATGAQDYLTGRQSTIGRALGIESSKRGQSTALSRWRDENAKGMALVWMSQLVDLGATRDQASSLVRERMIERDKSAPTIKALKDRYSRSSWSRLQRRFGVGTDKMDHAAVVAFLTEFPSAQRHSKAGKRRVLGCIRNGSSEIENDR